MNNYRNEDNRRVRIQDFLGGQYLSKEDLDGPTVVTITEVAEEKVEGERKLVASFEELNKRLILNTTNLLRLKKLFRATYPDEIQGSITLYVDPDVEMSGKVVGGIRVRAAATNGDARPRDERRSRAYQDSEDFF